MASNRSRHLLIGVIGAIAVAIFLAALGWLWRDAGRGDTGALALKHAGKLVVVGSAEPLDVHAEGLRQVLAASLPAVAAALATDDVDALRVAMRSAGADGLLVSADLDSAATSASIRVRLRRFDHVAGLSGRYLTTDWAHYVADEVHDIAPPMREALARVARAILGAAPPPRITSFPEPLRRVRHVEVMVMLRHRGTPRLWRSARGSSIARALLTASRVARRRWIERERAMGAPLPQILPQLDVEVALLQEDGTLGTLEPRFIDKVFKPVHGVGYLRKGAWRYLLPDATADAGGGSAAEAYQTMFADNALPPDSFDRSDLRLYRLIVNQLAVSEASASE